MEKFWEDIMNDLLGVVLYHGHLPDDETWCRQYDYEVKMMINDIKHFYKANMDAGIEVSDGAMANFLVFTEFEHIGNERLVKECTIDENQLLMVAERINNELKKERQILA